jgi:hypothetical protein
LKLRITSTREYNWKYSFLYFITVSTGLAGLGYEIAEITPFYVNMILASISLVTLIYLRWGKGIQRKNITRGYNPGIEHTFLQNIGVIVFLVVPYIHLMRYLPIAYIQEYNITLILCIEFVATFYFLYAGRFIRRTTPTLKNREEDESLKKYFMNKYGNVAKKIRKILLFDDPKKEVGRGLCIIGGQ